MCVVFRFNLFYFLFVRSFLFFSHLIFGLMILHIIFSFFTRGFVLIVYCFDSIILVCNNSMQRIRNKENNTFDLSVSLVFLCAARENERDRDEFVREPSRMFPISTHKIALIKVHKEIEPISKS